MSCPLVYGVIASFLAELSVKSPWSYLFSLSWKKKSWSKYPKNISFIFENRSAVWVVNEPPSSLLYDVRRSENWETSCHNYISRREQPYIQTPVDEMISTTFRIALLFKPIYWSGYLEIFSFQSNFNLIINSIVYRSKDLETFLLKTKALVENDFVLDLAHFKSSLRNVC